MPADQNRSLSQQITSAVAALNAGKIIAYPTEAVFGLGCDPFNPSAVTQLCALKKRETAKGLILIASDWMQIEPLVAPIATDRLEKVHATWPGPVTWVFPASEKAPTLVCAADHTLAVRITDHPVAKQLCHNYGKPIVSTSANVAKEPPFTDAPAVTQHFGETVIVVDAPVGERTQPSEIYRVETGERLR